MAKVSDLLVRIGADISGFQREMKNLQKSMQDTGKRLKDTGKTMTTRLTAPIAMMGGVMVKVTADFESAMNRVRAMTGATGDEFAALEKQAMDLGATTVFSAKEAAEGMTYLAMAGFEVDEIISAMPGMLDLAASAQMELGTAADITSNIMSGFTLEASEAARVADVLAKASSSSNTTVEQMGDAMSYAAPIANGLGLSVEEVAAAISFMSDAGIQGSRAGTALRSGLTRLMNPSGAVRDELNKLGVELFDSQGNMRSLENIIGDLNNSMADYTSEQRNAALSTIFGQTAASGWLAVLDRGGDELGDFTSELMNSEGAASDMAEIMNSGLTGSFVRLKSATEGLIIQFGKILAPVVETVVKGITKLVDWFSNTSDTTKTVIATVAGLVAAVGPLLIVIGTLMTLLGGLTAPIVAVVTGVAALVAIFVTLMTQSETFREMMGELWTWLQETVMMAIEGIKTFLTEAWLFIQELWTEHGEMIIEQTLYIFNLIWETIQTVLEIIFEIIQVIWESISEFWQEHGENIFNTVKNLFDNVWDTISTIMTFVLEFISDILDAIMDFWDKHGEWIMDFVFDTFMSIFNTVSKVLSNVWEFISNILSMIQEFWDKHGDKIMAIVRVAMDVIMGIIKFALPFIQGIFTTVFGVIETIVGTAWNVLTTIFETATAVIMDIVGIFTSLLTGDFEGAFEGLLSIVENIWEGIKGVFKGGINAVIGFVNSMIGGLNKISIKIPNWVPGFGGKNFGINIPKIPKLAEGGIVTQPTLALVGEGRESEAVIPLSKLDKMMDLNRNDDDKHSDNEPEEIIYEFNMPVHIDGEEVGRASGKFTKRELDERARSRNRLRGRDIPYDNIQFS